MLGHYLPDHVARRSYADADDRATGRGLEMLLIGALAAAVAYSIGALASTLTDS